MKLFTIGFTKRTAAEFFGALQRAGVRRIVDIRLNNTSQLAGFAKAKDLEYFLGAIANIRYVHLPQFAPTQDILDAFKKHKGDWTVYERAFNELLASRQAGKVAEGRLQDRDCLLCSEPTPDKCHRRLVAEHLKKAGLVREIVHL